MLLIFLFLLGLAIGSFLNVLILRTNTGMKLGGRSRCFSCLKKLEWTDLIPVVSYLTIRGRCRHCGSGISIQYPLVEMATGIVFVSLAYFMNPLVGGIVPILRYVLAAAFFSILVAISLYDIRHKIIPDQFSVALFVIAVLFEAFAFYTTRDGGAVGVDILSGLGAFSFFALLWFVSSGRWMGFGDAKIAISIGLFLGFPGAFLAILFAFWIGAFFALTMLALAQYSRKTEVPFAPFLAVGSYLAFLIAASNLLSWYYMNTNIVQ